MDFNEERMQQHVFALACKDEKVYLMLRQYATEVFFFNYLVHMFAIVDTCYVEWHSKPTTLILINEVKKYIDSEIIMPTEVKSVSHTIALMIDMSQADEVYVRKNLIDYVANKRFENVMTQYNPEMTHTEVVELTATLTQAVTTITEASGKTVTDYFGDDIDQRFGEFVAQYDKLRIATLIPGIDEMIGGGISVGELAVVEAASGIGKTIVLCNIGKGAVLQGKRVLHIQVGEMTNYLVARKYDSLFSRTDSRSTMEFNTIKATHNSIREKFRGKLFILYFPDGEIGSLQIEGLINEYTSKGLRPDILIVDYADNLVPTQRRSQDWEVMKVIWSDFSALVQRTGLPTWTATQSNRSGYDRKVIGMKHAAGTLESMKKANIVLALGQEDKEKAQQIIHIHAAKVRNSGSGMVRTFRTDYAKSTLYPQLEGTQNASVQQRGPIVSGAQPI